MQVLHNYSQGVGSPYLAFGNTRLDFWSNAEEFFAVKAFIEANGRKGKCVDRAGYEDCGRQYLARRSPDCGNALKIVPLNAWQGELLDCLTNQMNA